MRPRLLVTFALPDDGRAMLSSPFDVIDASSDLARHDVMRQHAGTVRYALTNGTIGFSAQDIALLPQLQLLGTIGVGYDTIDCAAALAAGIAIVNSPGTNADCVADHAFALLIAAVRRLPTLDADVRADRWRASVLTLPTFSGKRLGIVGLGQIGRKVAERAAGFGLAIGYHNRAPVTHEAFAYFPTVTALAHWADYLVVTTPGGAGTRHLIGRAELEALGPQGYLVNVSRGSVVDTAALLDALAHHGVAGAGLDVFEQEPNAPAALLQSGRVVLSPHAAGIGHGIVQQALALFADNVQCHLCGQPLLTPVAPP